MLRAARVAVLALLAASCRVEQHGSDDSAQASAVADDVARAVQVARALRADTVRSEAEVLADHGMTQEELGDLLYRIAADSAAAARYAELIENPGPEPTRPRPR